MDVLIEAKETKVSNGILSYRVIDRRTGKEPPSKDYVVTPEGEVAWWDESQGWSPDERQSRFEVQIISVPDSEKLSVMCLHDRLVKRIRKDRHGNLFECVDCGCRTPNHEHWVDPDAQPIELMEKQR